MTEDNKFLYEGMFLFNTQAIGGSLEQAVNHVKEILARAEAEVISLARWDERKLAYEIAGQKRGLYLLAHFKVRPAQVANIERDINLSELLLRGLLLRADHMGQIEIDMALAQAAKLADHVALAADRDEAEDAPAIAAGAISDEAAAEE